MKSRNDPVPDPLFLVRGKSGRLYVNGRHRHSFNKGVIQSNLYYVGGKLFLAPPNYPFPQGDLMCPIPSGPAKAHTAEAHRFEAYLRSKKLKLTGERMEILAAVFQKNAHFDAEELHGELKHHGRDISRATVYRTLDLLVQCGLVRKSSLGSSHANYEAAHEDEHHDHLICLNCNRVIEFYRPDLERAAGGDLPGTAVQAPAPQPADIRPLCQLPGQGRRLHHPAPGGPDPHLIRLS